MDIVYRYIDTKRYIYWHPTICVLVVVVQRNVRKIFVQCVTIISLAILLEKLKRFHRKWAAAIAFELWVTNVRKIMCNKFSSRILNVEMAFIVFGLSLFTMHLAYVAKIACTNILIWKFLLLSLNFPSFARLEYVLKIDMHRTGRYGRICNDGNIENYLWNHYHHNIQYYGAVVWCDVVWWSFLLNESYEFCLFIWFMFE